MGDEMGVLVVALVLLTWSKKSPSPSPSKQTIVEAVALFTSLLLA